MCSSKWVDGMAGHVPVGDPPSLRGTSQYGSPLHSFGYEMYPKYDNKKYIKKRDWRLF